MKINDLITGLDAKIQAENPIKPHGKMKHIKAYYQILHETKDLNGFQWFGYCQNSKGEYLHHFQKQEGKKWVELKVNEEDIENGNLEFMTLNQWAR